MRITCPNCQAQYDVDPAMIPEAGRDVQCSSCAHTWFQTRMEDAPEETLEADLGRNETLDVAPADERTPDSEAETAEAETQPAEDAPLPEEIEAETAPVPSEEDDEPWDEIAPEPDAEEAEAEEPLETQEDAPAAASEKADDGAEADAAETTEAAAEPEPAESEATAASDAPAPEESQDDDDRDAGDRIRAALDRPKEPPSAPEEGDGEDLRTSLRDAVTQAEAEAEAATDDAEPTLDQDVAGILREEAEIEVTRRRTEDAPPALEPQGDLDLDEGRASSVLRERLDRMRGDGIPEPTIAASLAAAGAAHPEAPRRERLPDIEQINSSLRPGEGADAVEVPLSPSEVAATRKTGFRTGFATVVVLAALAVAAYVYAPQIIRAVPAAEPAMISYVEIANATRDRIDGMMARAISGIERVTGSSNGA